MLLVILLQDRKTLLLKTTHIYVIKHGKIELLLNWKLHLYRLAITLLEYIAHRTEEGNNHQSHPVMKSARYSSDGPVRHAHGCNSGTVLWGNQPDFF